jgi:hypothetical protein
MDYSELHQLPTGTVVQDAGGRVWFVKQVSSTEVWLCPFSDEYSVWIIDGNLVQSYDPPPLPIIDTGLKSTGSA